MSEERWSLKLVVEAILFASQGPVSMKDLQGILKSAAESDKQDSSVAAFAGAKEGEVRAAIDELGIECADASRAYELRESAAGWQLVTKPAFAPWLRQLFPVLVHLRVTPTQTGTFSPLYGLTV